MSEPASTPLPGDRPAQAPTPFPAAGNLTDTEREELRRQGI